MKSITYAFILAISFWPALGALAPASAHASCVSGPTGSTGSTCNDVISIPATDTSTTTTTTTTTMGTNCVTNDSSQTYGNANFGHCVTADTQENSQSDTQDLNNSGAQQSMMLGMMATAAGAGMVAAGMSMTPPNGGLIAAGGVLIIAGMQGIQAAGNMANNAGIAGWHDHDLENIPTNTPLPGTPIDQTPRGTPGIDIDDSFTRTGKSGVVFDDFENKTGIDRADLVDGLKSGQSVAAILAGSGTLKDKGVSEAAVQDAIDQAASAGTPMNSSGVMDQLGLTPADLAEMAKNNSGSSEGSSYNLAGSNANRNPASAAAANSYGSFLGAGKESLDGAVIGGALGKGALSSDVQAALDKNGITDRSIFQMVHQKYKVKTPMMFGESARKPTSATENPFSNLGSGGQIEF